MYSTIYIEYKVNVYLFLRCADISKSTRRYSSNAWIVCQSRYHLYSYRNIQERSSNVCAGYLRIFIECSRIFVKYLLSICGRLFEDNYQISLPVDSRVMRSNAFKTRTSTRRLIRRVAPLTFSTKDSERASGAPNRNEGVSQGVKSALCRTRFNSKTPNLSYINSMMFSIHP